MKRIKLTNRMLGLYTYIERYGGVAFTYVPQLPPISFFFHQFGDTVRYHSGEAGNRARKWTQKRTRIPVPKPGPHPSVLSSKLRCKSAPTLSGACTNQRTKSSRDRCHEGAPQTHRCFVFHGSRAPQLHFPKTSSQ